MNTRDMLVGFVIALVAFVALGLIGTTVQAGDLGEDVPQGCIQLGAIYDYAIEC